MEGSIEYQVLIRHTTDLQVAVKDNLIHLGSQLVAAQIITPGQYEEIRNAYRSINEKGADLIGYIQNKVYQNPWHYHTFLGILRSDMFQYGDILAKLEQTWTWLSQVSEQQARLSHVSERQFVIPQPPPPREDVNRLSAQGILFLLVLSRFCMCTEDISSLETLSPTPSVY